MLEMLRQTLTFAISFDLIYVTLSIYLIEKGTIVSIHNLFVYKSKNKTLIIHVCTKHV